MAANRAKIDELFSSDLVSLKNPIIAPCTLFFFLLTFTFLQTQMQKSTIVKT